MGRHWLAALAFTFIAGHSAAAAPSIEDYARSPEIRSVRLSPSGERLASLVALPGGQTQLTVTDLPRKAPPRVVAGYKDAEILRFAWVNDNRLIYDVAD